MDESKQITEENTKEPQRQIRLYWIYDSDKKDANGDDWFLGGNPCPLGQEHFAEQHLKWRQKKHPNAYIVWEDGVYTYKESYIVAREKVEDIQRRQPGTRMGWTTRALSEALLEISKMEEIEDVAVARGKDMLDRLHLGTNEQAVLDRYRKETPGGLFDVLINSLIPEDGGVPSLASINEAVGELESLFPGGAIKDMLGPLLPNGEKENQP